MSRFDDCVEISYAILCSCPEEQHDLHAIKFDGQEEPLIRS